MEAARDALQLAGRSPALVGRLVAAAESRVIVTGGCHAPSPTSGEGRGEGV